MGIIDAVLFIADLPSDAAVSPPVGTPNPVLPTGGTSDILGLVSIVVIFIIVVYFAYFFTKFIGKSRLGGKKGVNIDMIEGHAVGVNSAVQLLRVGTRYFLIGVTKERITFISEIDREALDIETDSAPVNPVNIGKNLIEKLLPGGFKKKKENNGDDGDE